MLAPHPLRSLRQFFLFTFLILVLSALALTHAMSATRFFLGGSTTRVSVASDGTEGNANSGNANISGNGKYIIFVSNATNLVTGDTNNQSDLFLHDLEENTTTLVSLANNGMQGNAGVNDSTITSDGRYVAFVSSSSNLVPNDNNGAADVFVRDLINSTTVRVSVSNDGSEGNNQVNGKIAISTDGRFVAFMSFADNLVVADTNNQPDIFVRDRIQGTTERVNVSSNGIQANQESNAVDISEDGRYVTFASSANNLIPIDTNNTRDIFVHDRNEGITTLISLDSFGWQSNSSSEDPEISSDGRYVVFYSAASNLVSNDTNNRNDVFIHDRSSGITERVSIASDNSEGNGASEFPAISSNGRYITFTSNATNFVTGDTEFFYDIFVRDRIANETLLVSMSTNGEYGNADSSEPTLSDDGSIIGFTSLASNLVKNDSNGIRDVFAHQQIQISLTPTPTDTPLSTATLPPTLTNTPPPGATFTPTATQTPTATVTNTPTPGATFTPTSTATIPTAESEVYVPLVLQQFAFVTPPPATPTPMITNTPLPICEVVDREPNNFFSQANANLPMCEGGTVAGSVAVNDIDDYYRLQLDSTATVRIELTGIPMGADYDLYLYDASGGPVRVSNNSGSVNETIGTELASGRYYLRVYSLHYADPNTYQLRWVRE